ncbi:MAG: ABC transporter ATP-binding protein [Caldilineae bacterium]|nr:ABC transporter ATP-binding protein [Anaerolineae bacterium]MCB0205242.1 ABC transporter ATP-binding protein [Anaerolineae bacterium]MCB0255109.1 ABC transporter ATP-binding protein [Anaerolineae bacterium]MCB9153164.1 ABC transporter ATP-binding protein [Caldilineae bacterium]
MTKELLAGRERGATILELRGITKRFPGVVANDQIDFEMRAGEIHAILGENGAGKTTLMKILYGIMQPDEGDIYVRGQRVKFHSPLNAIELGIGMVHQNRKLVNAHTVTENIILGHPNAGRVLNLRRAEQEIDELCRRYGFKIDLRAAVWQLSEGEKQVVEILKALYRGAKILILDEPTSALAPPETKKLLSSVEAMADDELAIIPFITHKLPIVLSTSHRVTVLRGGRVIARFDTSSATEQSLAREMVGREVLFRVERPAVETGKPVLQVDNLSALSSRGFMAVKNVTFTVREGEIFGIAGVSGNGQHELAEVLAGLRKPEAGKVTLDGAEITDAPPLARWQAGLGYIPSERNAVGSIGEFSLVENVAMNYYFDDKYARNGLVDYANIRKLTEEMIVDYDVATPNADVKAKNLSGGNLQKVILARVLTRGPRLVIANLPTQGLDVGATEFVQNKLIEAKKNKAAVLLISEDLDEILAISDWIAPMYEGEFMGILPADEANRERVGALMAGLKSEREAQ